MSALGALAPYRYAGRTRRKCTPGKDSNVPSSTWMIVVPDFASRLPPCHQVPSLDIRTLLISMHLHIQPFKVGLCHGIHGIHSVPVSPLLRV